MYIVGSVFSGERLNNDRHKQRPKRMDSEYCGQSRTLLMSSTVHRGTIIAIIIRRTTQWVGCF